MGDLTAHGSPSVLCLFSLLTLPIHGENLISNIFILVFFNKICKFYASNQCCVLTLSSIYIVLPPSLSCLCCFSEMFGNDAATLSYCICKAVVTIPSTVASVFWLQCRQEFCASKGDSENDDSACNNKRTFGIR
jgi:hypothetical protein